MTERPIAPGQPWRRPMLARDPGEAQRTSTPLVVLRAGLEAQRLRAARANPARRTTMLRYVAGESGALVGWAVVVFLLPGAWALACWLLMAVVELAVPVWAARASRFPWHPRHITERYGLFTIIVLGESVLAATSAVGAALGADATLGDLATVAGGSLFIVFAIWWLYFAEPAHRFLRSTRVAFAWGYGHYLVFGSIAAVGAGIGVGVDGATHHAKVAGPVAGAVVTVPVAVFLGVLWILFLGVLWILQIRPFRHASAYHVLVPGTAVLVLAATFTGSPVLVTGLLLTGLVVALLAVGAREYARQREPRD